MIIMESLHKPEIQFRRRFKYDDNPAKTVDILFFFCTLHTTRTCLLPPSPETNACHVRVRVLIKASNNLLVDARYKGKPLDNTGHVFNNKICIVPRNDY